MSHLHQQWPLRALCTVHPRIIQFSLKLQLMKYTMLSLSFYLSIYRPLLLAHQASFGFALKSLIKQTIEFFIYPESFQSITLSAFKDALFVLARRVRVHPLIGLLLTVFRRMSALSALWSPETWSSWPRLC